MVHQNTHRIQEKKKKFKMRNDIEQTHTQPLEQENLILENRRMGQSY